MDANQDGQGPAVCVRSRSESDLAACPIRSVTTLFDYSELRRPGLCARAAGSPVLYHLPQHPYKGKEEKEHESSLP